ncbi:MAG: hypothetical protein JXC36_09125 [Candidatus Atribacteria bacterium]|nr:hypothetical protein [Candidatus Atribacteria bacterium]
MQNHNATIERGENVVNLVLAIGAKNYKICLTDDNPNEVKNVFNDLVVELKRGKYSFTLSDEKKDLYYNICEEYIKQLNGEIADVYSQLKRYELVENSEN